MNPKLKPPGTKRLKLKCDTLLSTSAFKFKLRRYSKGGEVESTDKSTDKGKDKGKDKSKGGKGDKEKAVPTARLVRLKVRYQPLDGSWKSGDQADQADQADQVGTDG